MAEQALNSLLDDVILEVVLEMHRKLVSGKLCLACPSPATDLVALAGHDVSGRSYRDVSVAVLLPCANCGQRIASTRFAPHLEKCLGRGGRGTRSRQAAATAAAAVAASAGGSSASSSSSPFVPGIAGKMPEQSDAMDSGGGDDDEEDDAYRPASKLYEKKKRKKEYPPIESYFRKQ